MIGDPEKRYKTIKEQIFCTPVVHFKMSLRALALLPHVLLISINQPLHDYNISSMIDSDLKI